ncbi:MAG: hypothetical protein JST64_00630, partial [Actinobacteria bacterium]|nr:hypothetical protein [Actinomycetota bacterium]
MNEVVGDVDLWSEVVGQPDAVAQLRAAVANPTHAYLIVGPEGSGTREAARAFAADLLADGVDPDRVALLRRQVAAGSHPSLVVLVPEGDRMRLRGELDVVIGRAHRAPPVGERQVLLLEEMHTAEQYAAAILKVLEEPPASTVFLLVAEELPEGMATIASRCVRIQLGPVPDAAIRDRLVAEGVDVDAAQVAAESAGGSMTQARLVGADPAAADRRALWYSLPGRLDGTGATAAALVDEVQARTDDLAAPLTARQSVERAEFEERAELVGRGVGGERKALIDRHRREQRRVRTADLRAGLAVLVGRYRDSLSEGGSPADLVAAAEAVQELVDRLAFNPNDTLQLQALM